MSAVSVQRIVSMGIAEDRPENALKPHVAQCAAQECRVNSRSNPRHLNGPVEIDFQTSSGTFNEFDSERRKLGRKNPTKILNYIPRHAFVVFFYCAIFTATIRLGSIIAFLVLMPDNEHGRYGVCTAFRAFSPGFLAAVLIAVASYRVLLSTRNISVTFGK